jgi:hypothetical protein
MLIVACVLAAFTGVANSRVASMLIAGSNLSRRIFVLCSGYAGWLIRSGSRKPDFSVSRYQSRMRICKVRVRESPRTKMICDDPIS